MHAIFVGTVVPKGLLWRHGRGGKSLCRVEHLDVSELNRPCSDQVSGFLSTASWPPKARSRDCVAILHEKMWESVKRAYKVDVIILYGLCFSVCLNKNELEVVYRFPPLPQPQPQLSPLSPACPLCSQPSLWFATFCFLLSLFLLSSPWTSLPSLTSVSFPPPASPANTGYPQGLGIERGKTTGRGAKSKVFTMQNTGGSEEEEEEREIFFPSNLRKWCNKTV